MRHIDADDLKRLILSGDDIIFDTATEREILHIIDKQKTVDAVEVVRCKDCKHSNSTEECSECVCLCEMFNSFVRQDFFCALGKNDNA